MPLKAHRAKQEVTEQGFEKQSGWEYFISDPRHSTQNGSASGLPPDRHRRKQKTNFHGTTTVLNFRFAKRQPAKECAEAFGRSDLSVPGTARSTPGVCMMNGPFRTRVAVVCTSKDSKVDVAIKAKAKASRSTYLDIGLGNIGRLEESVRHLTKWAVGICDIPVRSR